MPRGDVSGKREKCASNLLFINKFYQVKVKWRNQLRPKDIKQLDKYKRTKILSKSNHTSSIAGIVIIPIPLALLQTTFDQVQILVI